MTMGLADIFTLKTQTGMQSRSVATKIVCQQFNLGPDHFSACVMFPVRSQINYGTDFMHAACVCVSGCKLEFVIDSTSLCKGCMVRCSHTDSLLPLTAMLPNFFSVWLS